MKSAIMAPSKSRVSPTNAPNSSSGMLWPWSLRRELLQADCVNLEGRQITTHAVASKDQGRGGGARLRENTGNDLQPLH